MDTNKIIEQFLYFNIQADIDSIYGNWAVFTKGDVVNSLTHHAIFLIHFNKLDWIKELRTEF